MSVRPTLKREKRMNPPQIVVKPDGEAWELSTPRLYFRQPLAGILAIMEKMRERVEREKTRERNRGLSPLTWEADQ